MIAGRSGTLTLDYGYDPLGSLDSLIYPDKTSKVDFAPNAFGQATEAKRGSDVFAKSASYYPNGSINTFTYGNGVVHKTTLNNRNLPSQITDIYSASDRVNLSYSYDDNNNITSIINTRDAGIYSLTGLSYDGLDRLVSTTAGDGIGDSSMSYDGLGNLRQYSNNSSFNPHSLSYHYSSNRLTSLSGAGSEGYDFSGNDSYDSRGNVINNGKRTFNYNLANQMISSGDNHYVYDGYNRRIKTSDSKGISYSMYSQSGKLLYRETPVGGVNYIFLGAKLIAKEGVGVKSSGDSIMNYKPFGESIEAPKDEVGYTGHKFDTDLGLSYMQARYYDPVIGRFYSNDPIGFRDVHSFNRYAYVNNNPYKYVDPSGMCAEGTGKDGCTITGKTSGNISGTEIDPTSPSAVNGHAMAGDGTSRQADFASVDLSDLGASIQKFANTSGTQLADAISAAGASGNPESVNITGLKAGGGFGGDTSISQQGAIGRFSVSITGQVTSDGKGNWGLVGSVSGEADMQDYPYDPARTGAASALTRFGAGVQSVFGGKDYTINFAGSQTINVQGQ